MSSAYYQEVSFEPDCHDLELVSHDSLPQQSGRLDSVDEVYPHLVRISSTFGLQLLGEEEEDVTSSETSMAGSCDNADDNDEYDNEELKQLEMEATDTCTTTVTFSDHGSVRVHLRGNGGTQLQRARIQCPPNATRPSYSFPVHSYRTEVNKLSNISDDEWSTIQVAIVTQCSMDRLPQLSAMCKHWKEGIISATVYVKADDHIDIIVQKFETEWSRYSRIQVHVVYANHNHDNDDDSSSKIYDWYPINYLRNVALKHCRCRYVFLVDIDFMPCPDLYTTIAANLPQENECLVVPAFEWLHKSDYADAQLFELNKQQLIAKHKAGFVQPFQMDYFSAGHTATNFDKWMQIDGMDEQLYRVQYSHHYEPYIVVRNDDSLCAYDERFTGYGMNKIVHIAKLAIQKKFTFNVLCAGYIITLQHEKSNDFRRTLQSKTNNRRKWLRALFNTTMKEIKTGVVCDL
eukprot:CAMPEP_0202706662 /NCGR_PEP_ID=MMETSP1385-20130828/19053_1 /ASSEMBLY_ACC=CAM_ASM_000861 /TAXON_ID=933848 /ORGANISM="Elphidium margaritaceum" /LENGTH=459 /DNA_ID=CAMNT_0049365181 /DNA_START=313 /DNA_END=1692 /DNA_ORIENTATION=-